MRLWRRKWEINEIYVPSDYEFLDPDRPEISYESDLTPEERERMAPQIAEQKRKLAALRQGQRQLLRQVRESPPPWKMPLGDGREDTVGDEGMSEEKRAALEATLVEIVGEPDAAASD